MKSHNAFKGFFKTESKLLSAYIGEEFGRNLQLCQSKIGFFTSHSQSKRSIHLNVAAVQRGRGRAASEKHEVSSTEEEIAILYQSPACLPREDAQTAIGHVQVAGNCT